MDIDWQTIVSTLVPIILAVAVELGRRWLAKNQALAQWSDGAAVAAGRVYTAVAEARKRNSTASLASLLAGPMANEAARFWSGYQEVAAKIGGNEAAAHSRVEGEFGKLVAADPTVTIAAAGTAPIPAGSTDPMRRTILVEGDPR